ncbi:MAG: tRNA (adenosine(37)-N6)-dimethylallyltransferase MiaA [Bacteroidota bacterium]
MSSKSKFTGKLIVIQGPTASGKTGIAIELAKHFGAEIISADSRQFYKEIPIGTAAPTASEQEEATHHFIATLSIADDYNVSKYEHDVLNLLNTKFVDAPIVIMTGGSGLYIDAVCKGIDALPDIDEDIRIEVKYIYHEKGLPALQKKLLDLDPIYYQQVDLNNPKRLFRAIEVCLQTGSTYSELRKNKPQIRSFQIIKIGISIPRNILVERINNRVEIMMDNGWVEEAKSVYPNKHYNSLNTVGYKELFAFFDGTMSYNEAIEKIKTNTRRYAKRQMTWFRKDNEIEWFDYNNIASMINYIKQ